MRFGLEGHVGAQQPVVRVLEQVIVDCGQPQEIVMDNGPEFAGRTLDAWAYASGVTLQVQAASNIIVTSGGLATGDVNFSGGNYSIYVGAGGWASSGTTTFGNGNYLMAITGDWTNSGNLTMGAGSYSVSVTGNINIQGTTSTIGAGIYYISGNLNINGTGNETVTANNVTLVLTGATSIINYTANNSTFTLSAPGGSAWNAGIAVWEPTSTGSNLLASGNSSVASISGVFYAPSADVQFLGNTGTAPTCTQILAKSVEFGGNSININGDCSGVPGLKTFGQIIALVE